MCVCMCKSWLVTARWGVGVKQEVDRGYGGYGGGGSDVWRLTLIDF